MRAVLLLSTAWKWCIRPAWQNAGGAERLSSRVTGLHGKARTTVIRNDITRDCSGPIEDPEWLGIPRVRIPGNCELSRRLIEVVLQDVDVGFAEEWKFDHGMMVPLAHLTPDFDFPVIPANINCQSPPLSPMHRSYAFGRALRRAFDAVPERIALVGTGGTSHWPCTPDSGKINSAWDEEFLAHWSAQDVAAMTAYRDEDILSVAGHGGFEIRTSIAVAGAAGGKGDVRFYKPMPIFACGCLIASMGVEGRD